MGLLIWFKKQESFAILKKVIDAYVNGHGFSPSNPVSIQWEFFRLRFKRENCM